MTKDALYFRHDSNARTDPKIRALIKKYGMTGYGRFWVIIEMLRDQHAYKMEDEDFNWEALAEQMLCETKEVKAFVDDCVNKFKLFTQEDGYFYSLSLIARMRVLDNLRAAHQRGAFITNAKLGHNLTHDGKEPLD
jgi:hypothetical protein